MSNTFKLGRRIVARERIALVESFDPAANPNVKTDKSFRSRVVLIDRESVLAEFEPFAFAEQNGFRMLLEDNVAVNPGSTFRFGVETFEPAPDFNPKKPFRSRLTWRDLDGNTQSKLLLTEPEIALAIIERGEILKPAAESDPPREQPSGRRSRRRAQAAPGPV